jgi:hypothetical protein
VTPVSEPLIDNEPSIVDESLETKPFFITNSFIFKSFPYPRLFIINISK